MASRTFSERWHDWRTLQKVQLHPVDEQQNAGDVGEELFQQWVDQPGVYEKARCFRGKRVPNGSGRTEIDFIIVTPQRIHTIETKNWSGELFLRGNRWVQRRRDGREREHENLLAATSSKRRALVSYLKAQHIPLAQDAITHTVVFVNPNLHIEDPAISQHPNVITYERRHLLADPQQLIEYCIDHDDLFLNELFADYMQQMFRRIITALDQLKTWDRLQLHGGEVKKGDLCHLNFGPIREPLPDRCSGDTIWIDWERDTFKAGWQLLFGESLGHIILPNDQSYILAGDDTVTFHVVGEPTPTVFPLAEVESITFG